MDNERTEAHADAAGARWKALSPADRLARAREALENLVQGYITRADEKGAHWFSSVLLGLVRFGLENLRAYIDNPEETEVSWENPFVEIQYGASGWRWSEDRKLFVRYAEEEELAHEDIGRVRDTTAQVTWKTLHHVALSELTNNVLLVKREGLYHKCLPAFLEEELQALPESERQAALEDLYRPFSIGAVPVEDGEGGTAFHVLTARDIEELSQEPDATRDAALERKIFERLEQDAERFLPLSVNIVPEEGEPFTVSLVVHFHSFVLDEDEGRAFFPISVGLAFHPYQKILADGEELTFPNPAEWDAETQTHFWEGLFQELAAFEADVVKAGVESGETGTLPETPAPLRAIPPPAERKPTFPLAFGRTIADAEVLDLLHHIHKVRLPAKKWSTLPSWFELLDRERDRILAEEGDRAFEDLRETTGDQNARGPLLKRHYRRDGTEVVSLTAQAEKALKVREGLLKGFRYVDPKAFGREYFVRLFQAGSGFVEVGLSWFGIAGPWVAEWREELERQTKAAAQDRQLDLFHELDAERQEEVDRLVGRLHMLKDSHRLMETVVGQVYKQGTTEVRVPAVAFRELLKLHTDPNWKARVEGGLQALRACEFRVDSFGTGQKVKAYGTFLAEWRYRGAGAGDHGAGEYSLYVAPGFLGCLRAFESDRRRLSSGTEVLRLDFGKKLTEEDKAAHGWGYDRKAKVRRTAETRFVHFDAGRVFYHAAAGLTAQQENLAGYLERELTVRSAAVSRTLGNYSQRKGTRVPAQAHDAHEPRVYTAEACPLLAAETRYHAALGNFRRNPEAGRTLYGTRRRESATGGAHAEGLLAVLGYNLRSGRAVQERRRVVRAALEDFKAVVVDYLSGVVAARRGTDWLTLEAASKLGEKDLGKVSWFFFLPETWTKDRRRKWEETTGWRATEDPREVERARLELRGQAAPRDERDGLAALELRLRLQAARNERDLTTREVGVLFGVSHVTVQNWERGTEPDEDGKVRGKPIPEELVPLLLRWVDTGEPPTAEELAARRTRRAGLKTLEAG